MTRVNGSAIPLMAGVHASTPMSTTAADTGDVKTFCDTLAETAWGRYLTGAERRVLLRALDLAPPAGDALEVGCEGGRWSQVIAERRGSVICADVDAATLEVCAQRLPAARCVLTQPDDERLPAADRQLSLLLAYEVWPITNAGWFASEARRALAPNGILVFTYLNKASARGTVYRALRSVTARRRRWPTYYSAPPYAAARRSLVRAGFELVHEEGLAWAPFTRHSNSRWVPAATRLEQALGLPRLAAVSPWVLVIMRRCADAPAA